MARAPWLWAQGEGRSLTAATGIMQWTSRWRGVRTHLRYRQQSCQSLLCCALLVREASVLCWAHLNIRVEAIVASTSHCSSRLSQVLHRPRTCWRIDHPCSIIHAHPWGMQASPVKCLMQCSDYPSKWRRPRAPVTDKCFCTSEH